MVLYLELAADTSTVVENKKLQRGERKGPQAHESGRAVAVGNFYEIETDVDQESSYEIRTDGSDIPEPCGNWKHPDYVS